MDEKVKSVKPAEQDKAKKNSKKKPNAFVRFFKWLGRKIKEMFSEIKKVTWPKLPKVIKTTGVVLGVILVFLILITAIDSGFSALQGLIVSK